MPRRRRCPRCNRLIGTYRGGSIRPHLRPSGRSRCPVAGPQFHRPTVRRFVTAFGARAAAERLGTSFGTLRRHFGQEPWWPRRDDNPDYGRHAHTGHAPGQSYKRGCEGCVARRREAYERTPRFAVAAQRAAEREAELVRAIAAEAALEADRAYVAAMVGSGRAVNLRRALGVTAAEAEQRIGLGRTALNKIENRQRPPCIRVRAHARNYAALLREWETEAARRGLDLSKPHPKINRRRTAA